MGLFDRRNHINAFQELLKRERDLILTGDIVGVQRLSTEKTRLLARLGKSRLDAETLESLRDRAERNNRLLEASARGFKTVQEQLRQLDDAPASLKTYGSDGQRSPLRRGGPGVNKKA